VADASLFPESLGNPPILTIVAMAKRIGRLLVGEVRTARLMRAVIQSQRR
jgi:choline dehydrogenase-like flavoprotein